MSTSRIHFRMRSYQRRAFEARQGGCKRFVEVLHRRAGKDRNWLNITLTEAMKTRGTYFHIFPSLNQGRRDLWDNIIGETIDGQTRRFPMTDMFPSEFVVARNETEMQITLKSGSIWQIMGADSPEAIARLRGPNPVGIVFSEYAHMLSEAWTVLSPVLAENGGWAAFISTPNGQNHFHELYLGARDDPNWFCQLLTINDTKRDSVGEDGSSVIPIAEIEDLRKHGTREEDIQQEFFCSFEGYARGTIYGDLVTKAESEKRISRFPYVPTLPVGVSFDLGHSDQMVMWFYQIHNPLGRYFIDFWEDRLKDIKDAAFIMREQKRYTYGRIILPWDGWSAANYLEEVGFKNVVVVRRSRTEGSGDEAVSLQAQIDEVRRAFSTFYFDSVMCEKGIDHLKKYSRKYDRDKRVFLHAPIHDEHSHAADGLRTAVAGGFTPLLYERDTTPLQIETIFDPRNF